MTELGTTSRAESVTQFLTVFLVFLLVLALTYFTTRFVGAFQKNAVFNRNFEAIETYKITNGKYLQLVRIGEKYMVIGISKDSINPICELTEDEILLKSDTSGDLGSSDSFKILIDKAKKRITKGGNKNEE